MLSRSGEYLLVTRLAAVPLSLLVAMLLFSFVERRFAHGLVTEGNFWPWRATSAPESESAAPELEAGPEQPSL